MRDGIFCAPGRFYALRQKSNFLSRIKLIWVVQSGLKKYSASRLTQIKSISPAILSH
jgi:hypothetical protein